MEDVPHAVISIVLLYNAAHSTNSIEHCAPEAVGSLVFSILTIIWGLLSRKLQYDDLGGSISLDQPAGVELAPHSSA